MYLKRCLYAYVVVIIEGTIYTIEVKHSRLTKYFIRIPSILHPHPNHPCIEAAHLFDWHTRILYYTTTPTLSLLPLIPTAKMNTNCEYTSPRWISLLFNCQARSQRQFLRFRAHTTRIIPVPKPGVLRSLNRGQRQCNGD